MRTPCSFLASSAELSGKGARLWISLGRRCVRLKDIVFCMVCLPLVWIFSSAKRGGEKPEEVLANGPCMGGIHDL